jgi:PAS domain S-box-containing protein
VLGVIVLFRSAEGARSGEDGGFSDQELRAARALARQTAATVEYAYREHARDWAYLESLFANAPEAVVLLDAHHRVVRINREFTRLFGYSAEEIRGGLIDDFVASGERWDEARDISSKVEAGGHVAVETKRRRKDGTELDVSILGAPVFDDGEIVGIFGIYRDITEQKRTEAALRESEARYRDIFEQAPVGIFQTHSNGRVVRVNGTIARMLGYASASELSEAVNSSAYRIFADPRRRQKFLTLIKEHGAVSNFQYQAVCRDGSQVTLSETSRISDWKSEDDFIIDGFVIDITALKNAQKELSEKERRLRGIFDAAREVAIVLAEPAEHTGEMLISEFSAGAERMLGYSSAEAVGLPLLSLHTEGEHEGLGTRLRSVSEKGEAINEELSLLRRDGSEVPVLFTAHPVLDRSGAVNGIVEMAVDISERKRAERAIEQSLREKEVLLQEIHHRVKNNMQIISSILSLEVGHLSDPTVRRALGVSQNRIRSMALIHEKLYRSQDLARVDLSDYVSDLCADLKTMSPHGAALSLELDTETIHAGVDFAIPFGLVVNELVTNAFKHAKPEDGATYVSVKLHVEPRGTVLVVSDNGPGLPEDFETSESSSLGMELVHSLVDQLHGTIDYDFNHGAEWRVVIPPAGSR